ncbi:MAG: tyrosine-type recombinase/integrase [Clostridiales bacterium]|jgi:integrase|nr:tyrosine-type recombinase/integrase [Clostridiales bacterium]
MSTTQPIRNKNQIRELAEYYLKRGKIRNHLLIIISVHTALRISDILRLKWGDVYDFEHQSIRENITIVEKKTGKPKTILLNKAIKAALTLCLPFVQKDFFLIKSHKGENQAISRIQAYRIISEAAKALCFGYKVSCHSLRKTFGYLAWKNGINPVIIMEIYNHSNFAVTRRYLGVTQEDKDEAYIKLANLI